MVRVTLLAPPRASVPIVSQMAQLCPVSPSVEWPCEYRHAQAVALSRAVSPRCPRFTRVCLCARQGAYGGAWVRAGGVRPRRNLHQFSVRVSLTIGNMKTLAAALVLALLTACASQMPYTAGPAPAQPKQVVERVIYESNTGYQGIVATDDYLEYADPSQRERRLVVLRGEAPVYRIYYRSIESFRVYKKGSSWSVVVDAAQGSQQLVVYPPSEADAKLLVDALEALRKG